MMDIREKFFDKLEAEYKRFHDAELKKTKEQIYNDAYEILFYDEIYGYFQNVEMDDELCETLYVEELDLIASLCRCFLKWENESINSYADIEHLISGYIDYFGLRKDAGIEME